MHKHQLIIVAMFAVFLAPILAAMWLNFAHPDWTPFGYSNKGQLIEPVRAELAPLTPANASAVAGPPQDWMLLSLQSLPCANGCQQALASTRRVRLALGHRADEVRLGLAVLGGLEATEGLAALRAQYPDVMLLALTERDRALLEQRVNGEVSGYAVRSPEGDLFLHYAADADLGDIVDDLERVLKADRTR